MINQQNIPQLQNQVGKEKVLHPHSNHPVLCYIKHKSGSDTDTVCQYKLSEFRGRLSSLYFHYWNSSPTFHNKNEQQSLWSKDNGLHQVTMADYCDNMGLVVTDLRESIHSACRHPSLIIWLIGNRETRHSLLLERAVTWRGLFSISIMRILTYSREHPQLMPSVPTGSRVNTHSQTHTHTLLVSFPHILIITARSPEAPSSSLHLVIQADKSFFFFLPLTRQQKNSEEHWKFCWHHPAQ